MTNHKYILDENGEPKIEDDLYKWAAWMETKDHQIARDVMGDCWVSTILLGLDHNFSCSGCPIIWETMTFSESVPDLHRRQDRCGGSREQALAMHQEALQRLIAALNEKLRK